MDESSKFDLDSTGIRSLQLDINHIPDPRDAGPAQQPTGNSYSPFVRRRTPHLTQEAINDLDENGNSSSIGYAHDSNYAARGKAFSGGHTYRRARSEQAGVRRGQYGQYLEVPKGKRSIFSTHERARRKKTAIACAIAAVVIIGAIVVVAHLLMR